MARLFSAEKLPLPSTASFIKSAQQISRSDRAFARAVNLTTVSDQRDAGPVAACRFHMHFAGFSTWSSREEAGELDVTLRISE